MLDRRDGERLGHALAAMARPHRREQPSGDHERDRGIGDRTPAGEHPRVRFLPARRSRSDHHQAGRSLGDAIRERRRVQTMRIGEDHQHRAVHAPIAAAIAAGRSAQASPRRLSETQPRLARILRGWGTGRWARAALPPRPAPGPPPRSHFRSPLPPVMIPVVEHPTMAAAPPAASSAAPITAGEVVAPVACAREDDDQLGRLRLRRLERQVAWPPVQPKPLRP